MNRQKYSRKIEVRAKFYEIALMNTEKLLKRLAHPIRKRILPWQDRSSKFIKFSIHSFCNFASFLLHFQFQVFQHLFHSAWNKHIFVHYSCYFFPILNSEQNRTESINRKTVINNRKSNNWSVLWFVWRMKIYQKMIT